MEERDQAGYSGSPHDPFEVDRGFRKLYWSFGLKVLAGAGIIALTAVLPLPSKWWALPFILSGGWLVLVNLSSISVLAKAHHNYRNGPEDKTPLKEQDHSERQVHIASYVVLGITLVAMKPLSRPAENILEEERFVLVMGTVGVAVAAFVLWWIKRMVPGYYQRNSEARAGAVLGLFISIVFLVVLGSAWLDHTSAGVRTHVQRYAVKETGGNVRSGSIYLFLYRQGQRSEDFRIRLHRKELESITGRDSVDLLLGIGDLGFEHVLGVRP